MQRESGRDPEKIIIKIRFTSKSPFKRGENDCGKYRLLSGNKDDDEDNDDHDNHDDHDDDNEEWRGRKRQRGTGK